MAIFPMFRFKFMPIILAAIFLIGIISIIILCVASSKRKKAQQMPYPQQYAPVQPQQYAPVQPQQPAPTQNGAVNFCPSCGAKVNSATAAFCAKCGNKF